MPRCLWVLEFEPSIVVQVLAVYWSQVIQPCANKQMPHIFDYSWIHASLCPSFNQRSVLSGILSLSQVAQQIASYVFKRTQSSRSGTWSHLQLINHLLPSLSHIWNAIRSQGVACIFGLAETLQFSSRKWNQEQTCTLQSRSDADKSDWSCRFHMFF